MNLLSVGEQVGSPRQRTWPVPKAWGKREPGVRQELRAQPGWDVECQEREVGKPGSGGGGEGWGRQLRKELRVVLRTLYLNLRARTGPCFRRTT